MKEDVIDDRLIAAISKRIADAVHPRRIVLFGSRARGDADRASDVDLFIEMETSDRPLERRRKIRALFEHQWWPMDLLVCTPREVAAQRESLISLVPVIEREGKVLYEGGQ